MKTETTIKPVVSFIKNAETGEIVPFSKNLNEYLASSAYANAYIEGMQKLTNSNETEWTQTFEQALGGKVYYTVVPTDELPWFTVTKIALLDDCETCLIKDNNRILNVTAETTDRIWLTEDDAEQACAEIIADKCKQLLAEAEQERDAAKADYDDACRRIQGLEDIITIYGQSDETDEPEDADKDDNESVELADAEPETESNDTDNDF